MVHSVLERYRNATLISMCVCVCMCVWCCVRVTRVRGCVTKKRFGGKKCDASWIWTNYAGKPSEVLKMFVVLNK